MKFVKIVEDPNPQDAEAARQLGLAARLLFDGGYGRYSIASLMVWVMPAIRHRQILFMFDPGGRPVAFVAWAYVSDDVLDKLRRDELSILDRTEWNAGLNLWVTEVVARGGTGVQLMLALRRRLAGKFTAVNGLRRTPGGEAKKVISRRLRGVRKNESDCHVR